LHEFIHYTIHRAQAGCINVALSIYNLGIAAMMGALGIIALVHYNPSSLNDLTQLFLSIYMAIFATLLFSYELIFWTHIPKLNVMYRKNFGFLYGLKGKGLFLIFIAFLTLGLLDDSTQSYVKGLDWATGIAWLAGGCLHLFVSCTMPEVNQAYKPPMAGLDSMGEAQGATPNPV